MTMAYLTADVAAENAGLLGLLQAASALILVMWFVVSLALSIIPAHIAKCKGYDKSLAWIVYGFFVWPLAMLHVALLPRLTPIEVELVD